jgi:hypothetical protein
VAGTLLTCTPVTGAAVVVLGAARTFPLAIAAYLVVATVRPLFSPQVTQAAQVTQAPLTTPAQPSQLRNRHVLAKSIT